MRRTEILVDQAGNFTIDQQGFTGTACQETTDKLLTGIKSGGRTEEKKPEFHNRAGARATAQQRW